MDSFGMAPHVAPNEYGLNVIALTYTSLGLAGEAGEVANKVKKILRGDYSLDAKLIEQLAGELGDVLWYVAQTARRLGLSLDEIAAMNLSKLRLRLNTDTLKGSGDNREKELSDGVR